MPEGVRHAYVLVDPEARPDWAQLQPAAPTDRCHALDKHGNSLVGARGRPLLLSPYNCRRGELGTSGRSPCRHDGATAFCFRPQATDEAKSEAVKRLKPHVLKEIIDTFKMDQALIFCRTNFDCDNLEAFLTAVGGGRRARGDGLRWRGAAGTVAEARTALSFRYYKSSSLSPARVSRRADSAGGSAARLRRGRRTPTAAACLGGSGPWRSAGRTSKVCCF